MLRSSYNIIIFCHLVMFRFLYYIEYFVFCQESLSKLHICKC